MSRAYRDGLDSQPYTGGGKFTDFLRGENDRRNYRPNNGGGSGGCGAVILFFLALWLLLLIIPLSLPAIISASIMAIFLTGLSAAFFSISPAIPYRIGFKSILYSQLWHIPLAFVVTIIVSSGIGLYIAANPEFLEMSASDTPISPQRGYVTLLLIQSPAVLITGIIFRNYLKKYLGGIPVSYWKSVLFMAVASAFWLALVYALYYYWKKLYPESYHEMTATLLSAFS